MITIFRIHLLMWDVIENFLYTHLVLTIGIVSITRLCNQKLTEKKHITISIKKKCLKLSMNSAVFLWTRLLFFIWCVTLSTFLCVVVVYPGFIICELELFFYVECVSSGIVLEINGRCWRFYMYFKLNHCCGDHWLLGAIFNQKDHSEIGRDQTF